MIVFTKILLSLKKFNTGCKKSLAYPSYIRFENSTHTIE